MTSKYAFQMLGAGRDCGTGGTLERQRNIGRRNQEVADGQWTKHPAVEVTEPDKWLISGMRRWPFGLRTCWW